MTEILHDLGSANTSTFFETNNSTDGGLDLWFLRLITQSQAHHASADSIVASLVEEMGLVEGRQDGNPPMAATAARPANRVLPEATEE